MLRELYPEEMKGRDWFYRLMHEKHLMLKPLRRRHTTNSNHNYRKYSNLTKGNTKRPHRSNRNMLPPRRMRELLYVH